MSLIAANRLSRVLISITVSSSIFWAGCATINPHSSCLTPAAAEVSQNAISKALRASPLKLVAVAGNSTDAPPSLNRRLFGANVVISLGTSLRYSLPIFIPQSDLSDLRAISNDVTAEGIKGRSLTFQLVNANSGTPYVFDLPAVLNNIDSMEARRHCVREVLSASERHSSTRLFGLIRFDWLSGGLTLGQMPKRIELEFSSGRIEQPPEISAYLLRLKQPDEFSAVRRTSLQITTDELLADSIDDLADTILQVFGTPMNRIEKGENP